MLQFASIHVVEFCAGPPNIMRCEVFKLEALGTVPDHIPDDILRNAASPGCPVTTDGPEDKYGRHRCSCQPSVHSTLHPKRHWNCANVVAFANKVYDRPVTLSDLNILLPEGCQLCPAQTTAEQDRYHGDVANVAKVFTVRRLKEQLGLFAVQPILRGRSATPPRRRHQTVHGETTYEHRSHHTRRSFFEYAS